MKKIVVALVLGLFAFAITPAFADNAVVVVKTPARHHVVHHRRRHHVVRHHAVHHHAAVVHVVTHN